MKPIYLNRVELSQFRAYKHQEPFKLDLPDESGLTVIVGANGLGKSTIFDGVEWALTGEVSRLPNQTKKTLEAAIGSQAEVVLHFSGDQIVNRNFHTSSLTEDINNLLMVPGWESSGNANQLLSFTHFLGQTIQQHIVQKGSKERWDQIKGLARFIKMERIQNKLDGRKTTTALNVLDEEVAKRISVLENDRELLEQWHSQSKEWTKLADASQMLDDEGVLEKVVGLLEKLSSLFPDIIQENSVLEKETALAVLSKVVDLSSKRLISEQKKNEHWLNRLVEINDLNSEKKTIQERLIRTKADIDQTAGLLVPVEAQFKEQLVLLYKQEEALKVHQLRSQQLGKLLELIQQQTKIKSHFDEIQIGMKALQILLPNFKLRHELKQMENVYLSFQNESKELAERRKKIEEDKKIFPEKKQRNEFLTEQIVQTTRKKDLLVKERKRARDRLGILHEAVATIATALTEMDHQCPVCKVDHNKGQLKELAMKSTSLSDETLAKLESQVKDLEEAEQQYTEEQNNIRLFLAEYSRQEKAITELQKKCSQRLTLLQSSSSLENVDRNKMFEMINQGLDHLNVKISASVMGEAFNQEGPLNKVKNSYQSMQLDEFQQNIGLMMAKAEQSHLLLEEKKAEISALHNALNEEALSIEKITIKKSEVTHKIEALKLENVQDKKKLSTASEQRKKLQVQLETNNEIDVKAKKQLKTCEKRINHNRVRWQENGYEGDPKIEPLLEAKSRWEKVHDGLAPIIREKEQIVEARKKWQELHQQQVVSQNLQKLYKKYKGDGYPTTLTIINQNVDRENRMLEHLDGAKKKRDQLKISIKGKTQAIRNNTLQPLNRLINQFSAALLTGFDYQVEMGTDSKRGVTFADILLRGVSETKIDPKHRLSEGQFSALNAAMMLSASITFPWSNWRALLLDDPLQHNDTIHGAALVDVLRNLIIDKKYQIIISTHDEEEANYFLRKCRNAGIGTRYCHLLSRSEQGVRWQTG